MYFRSFIFKYNPVRIDREKLRFPFIEYLNCQKILSLGCGG